MSDLLDEDLEFRGGTLQLSTDLGVSESFESINPNATDNNRNTPAPHSNTNPSVLSGANSLSSSSTSFADAVPVPAPARSPLGGSEPLGPSQPVCPRYDVPFSREAVQALFSSRRGVVDTAIQECITALLFPEDGEFLGAWLLTEITLWDNEKERVVLLTSRLVMTVKYDFIAMRQLDFRKTYLDDLDTVVIGELVYPPSSLVPRLNGLATGVSTVVKEAVVQRLCRPHHEPEPGSGTPPDQPTTLRSLFDPKYFQPRERNLRGVRLLWNRGVALPVSTAWNPFSRDVPFLTFASHPLYWYKDSDAEDRLTYDMETFALKLQRAIESAPSSGCRVHHEPVVIQSYVGVASMLHNKTGLGFFKVRGKFSF